MLVLNLHLAILCRVSSMLWILPEWLWVFFYMFIVNDQAHGGRARFSHQKIRAMLAGIVPVFILLDEASIYTFVLMAFHPVDFVLWGGYGGRVTTDPSNSGSASRSIGTSYFQDRGGDNAPRPPSISR